MSAWRNFVHQKLIGNDAFDIGANSPEDWPAANDWQQTLAFFAQTQQWLLADLAAFDPARWEDIVPGRPYSFGHMINGIVQHDMYHYGQIGALLAVVKKFFDLGPDKNQTFF